MLFLDVYNRDQLVCNACAAKYEIVSSWILIDSDWDCYMKFFKQKRDKFSRKNWFKSVNII